MQKEQVKKFQIYRDYSTMTFRQINTKKYLIETVYKKVKIKFYLRK